MHPVTIIRKLYRDFQLGSPRGAMIRSAAGTVALKVGGTIIGLAATVFYARVLGPFAFGVYAFVMAGVGLITIPAALGFSRYLVREGANSPSSMPKIRRWADRWIIVTGLFAAAVLIALGLFSGGIDACWLFVLASPIPFIVNRYTIRQSLLQACGKIIQSQVAQLLVAPAAVLACTALIWLVIGELDPWILISANITAALITLTHTSVVLKNLERGARGPSNAHVSIRFALPFMWLGMLHLINARTDLIMLALLGGPDLAGAYAVASRAGELMLFVLVSANTVIAPQIAKLHSSGDRARLQRLLRSAVGWVSLLTLPIALLFIFFAEELVVFFFGPAYEQASIALRILVLAQIVNVAVGSTGLILTMTGHENHSVLAVAVGVVANIGLNVLLIPHYGVAGAAVATALSIVIWNLIQWYWVRSMLRIRPSVLGL